jgi:hypothetical protein
MPTLKQDYKPRVRAKFLLPCWLKDELEAAARDPRVDTSTSQLVAFLLAAAMDQFTRRDYLIKQLQAHRSPAHSIKYGTDIAIPDEYLPQHDQNY